MAAVVTAERPSAPPDPSGAQSGENYTPSLGCPDASYIIRLADDLREWYRADGSQLREFRKLLKGKKPPGIPEKYRHVDTDVRLRDMDEQLTRLASLMAGHFPKIQVEPLENEGDQANATKRMVHEQVAMEQAFRAAQGGNRWRAGVAAQLGDGGAVFKMIPRRDVWSDADNLKPGDYQADPGWEKQKPGAKSASKKYSEAREDAKKRAGVPVVIVDIDVETWHPLWEDTGITASLEIVQRNANATLKKYRLGIEQDAKGELQIKHVGPGFSQNPVLIPKTINTIEYIDDEWMVVVVENQGKGVIVWDYQHPYGRIPVFPMWGRNFTRGNRRGEPIIENMAGYQETLNTFLTIALNAGLVQAVPPILHEIPEGSDMYLGLDGTGAAVNKVQVEKYELGTRIMGRPGEKLTPLNIGTLSESAEKMVDRLFAQMEKLGMPRAAEAIQGDLEGAGPALYQILADLKEEKSDVLDEQMSCLREMTHFYEYLIRNCIGEVVYVEGIDPTDEMGKKKALIGLEPADLEEQVSMNWDVDWSQDAAKAVLVNMVHTRIEHGTLDIDEGIRRLGDSPDQINRGKVVDHIRASNIYLQVAEEQVAQAVGRGDDNDALKRAIELMQQEQGNGGITPPNNPAQQLPGPAVGAPPIPTPAAVQPPAPPMPPAPNQPGTANQALAGLTRSVARIGPR